MRQLLRQIMRMFSLSAPGACHDVGKSYEEAIRTLNTLQSNAAVIDKLRQERSKTRHMNLIQTQQFAERTGITLDDLDKLSVIHVSGTKGKGSTCAFCESILRTQGYKTGFYSSPHLVEVRERIRINGQPLSKEAFSTYFWECYRKLEETKEASGGSMPAYFRFLTLMAFNVFLQEKVDVAIIEVGIGGQYDCTNIIRNPVVCGVTSLGLDHMSILGDTIEQIAWNKAGIFKPLVPAVTVQQPGNSLQVIINRSKEIGNPLHLIPDLSEYDWSAHPIRLGIAGSMQLLNASLALQLCRTWINDHNKSIEDRKNQYINSVTGAEESIKIAPTFNLSSKMVEGLEMCRWPGRNQEIRQDRLTYYLDGAHTPKSIEQCVEWFREVADNEKQDIKGDVVRVLLFNATGDRKPESLLEFLPAASFDYAVFCPNIATNATDNAGITYTNPGHKMMGNLKGCRVEVPGSSDTPLPTLHIHNKLLFVDQTNYTVTIDSQLARCVRNKNAWLTLTEENHIDSSPPKRQKTSVESEKCNSSSRIAFENTNQSNSSDADCEDLLRSYSNGSSSVAFTFSSIQEALQWITQGRDPNIPRSLAPIAHVPSRLRDSSHIQILCTGSLHLIGGVLRMVDENIINS